MFSSEDIAERNMLMDRYYQLEESILDNVSYNIKKIPEQYRGDFAQIRQEADKASKAFRASEGALKSINISLAHCIERLELIEEQLPVSRGELKWVIHNYKIILHIKKEEIN